jgi:NAD(P)H-hydrate epimerase
MKLFKTDQIRQLDEFTIQNEPIASIGLMERAANRMLQQFKKDWDLSRDVLIFAGPGNNGGDGLALGRMLLETGYDVQIVLLHKGKLSNDCETNKDRLLEFFPETFIEQVGKFSPIEISEKTLIVDALFGTGLSRPLDGFFAEAVDWINKSHRTVISIDIPSGLDGEKCGNENEAVIHADYTYTLQFPKLSFLFAENETFVGKWTIIDIQLHPKGIEQTKTPFYFVEKKEVKNHLKTRKKFAHKGNFGHVCIIAGSKGMAGAAILASKAALKSGSGLVSVFSTEENRIILQSTVPEAMFHSQISDWNKFSVLACGPGMGTDKNAKQVFEEFLEENKQIDHLILDADALNLLAENPKLWELIPMNTIITPHPKEFERLFGSCENSLQRLQLAKEKAMELNIFIVLKGAYTAICTPNGEIFFNSTGNPGMATGGMGDVLTGIIAGLVAQGYSHEESAILGVYLHGLAGDIALNENSEESLLPSDLIQNIGKSFKMLKQI